ncbi:unnamed protein product [Clavelina lepadiformis]|uniref:Uncharacterized protein n=1 Tax=Clavelina lepadiformis TaxID=159417 RepID=A0ABP0GE67_CLALP
MKTIKESLRLNGYSNSILNRCKFRNNTRRFDHYHGFVVLLHTSNLSDKLRRILSSQSIKTAFKPAVKICNLLSSSNRVPSNDRQGVVYEIPCQDCSSTLGKPNALS